MVLMCGTDLVAVEVGAGEIPLFVGCVCYGARAMDDFAAGVRYSVSGRNQGEICLIE